MVGGSNGVIREMQRRGMRRKPEDKQPDRKSIRDVNKRRVENDARSWWMMVWQVEARRG